MRGLRKLPSEQPGLIVSGVAHGALLVAALVAFSHAAPFVDAQEAIPVEMVSQSEFNEIMKGEKTAKEIKPAPPKAEKVADTPLPKPQPAVSEAKADTPVPPPPLRHAADPVAEPPPPKPEAAKPAQPPPRPHAAPVKAAEAVQPLPAPPAKPSPPKAEPPKENPDDALVVVPKPRPPPKPEPPKPEPPKVEPPKVAETPPAPAPRKVRPAEKPKAPAQPQAKPLDEVAKLLERKKLDDLARQAPTPPKPTPPAPVKPATPEPTPTPQRVYDPNSIAKLINRDKPQQAAAAAPEVSHTASIGASTQSAPRMSQSLMAALDGLMTEQIYACWTDDGLGRGGYAPEIRVQYARDGSLIGQPVLLNPSADANLQNLADSALRAVRRCNPLKIPAQYAPYYEEWRQRRWRLHAEDRTG